MKAGVACDDGVAGHFVNEKLFKFVSSRPNAKAYRVQVDKNKINEQVECPEVL